MRWVWRGMAGLVGLVLLLGVAAWFLLDRFDLGGLAARRATAALGRPVTVGALHVTPGRWVTVTLRNATVANMEGGTRPEMVRLDGVRAELAFWPLLRGRLVMREVVVDGADVLLERVEGRGPNWRFGPAPAPKEGPPKRDGTFPDLARLVASGTITVRTSAGNALPIGLDHVTFTAPAPDAPTRLEGPVTYKGVPIQVKADLGSIAQYRDAAAPFPATFDLAADGVRLRFTGTLADPLNMDGAAGELDLDAAKPPTLFRIAGAESGFGKPVKLFGALTHAGLDWEWSRLQGALGAATIFGGTLHLIEGMRPSDTAKLPPDRLGVALQFETLDVDALTGGGGGGSGGDDPSLAVEAEPSMLVAARLRAKDAVVSGLRLSALELDASQAPGLVTVEAFSFGYAGGKLAAHGEARAEGRGSAINAELQATGLEVQAIRRLLSMNSLPVNGRVSATASLRATGATLEGALPGARASLVLTMAGGSVSRQVVQLGSTDLRALFGGAAGTVPVSCVLGVLDMRGGVATLSPVRLRTAEGTIAARGTVDLVRKRVDLVVASEAETTGALALDVPVRVSGAFADPDIAPATLSAQGRAQARAGDDISRLLPGLQGVARNSPCLGR